MGLEGPRKGSPRNSCRSPCSTRNNSGSYHGFGHSGTSSWSSTHTLRSHLSPAPPPRLLTGLNAEPEGWSPDALTGAPVGRQSPGPVSQAPLAETTHLTREGGVHRRVSRDLVDGRDDRRGRPLVGGGRIHVSPREGRGDRDPWAALVWERGVESVS